MKDYYKILDIENNQHPNYRESITELTVSITSEVVLAHYKDKIRRFKGLPFLTNKMIADIKLLKEAFYVLHDENRKKKYDKLFKKYKQTKLLSEDSRIIDNTKICDRLFSLAHITK
jgi:hypothetical protein